MSNKKVNKLRRKLENKIFETVLRVPAKKQPKSQQLQEMIDFVDALGESLRALKKETEEILETPEVKPEEPVIEVPVSEEPKPVEKKKKARKAKVKAKKAKKAEASQQEEPAAA